jgi:hypothetical protein
MKVIRPLLALLLFIPLSYSFVLQFIEQLFPVINLAQPQIWFWSACGVMALFSLIFIRQSSFIAILKHELCHNIFAILTFRKPTGLHVTAGKGGEFQHEGKTNFLMILAPYFFPLLSAVMMLISLLDIRSRGLFFGLLGATIGFDLLTALKDIHLKQTDLRKYGLFFSWCFILLVALIFYGMIIAYVTNGYSAAGNYFIEGFSQAWKRVAMVF